MFSKELFNGRNLTEEHLLQIGFKKVKYYDEPGYYFSWKCPTLGSTITCEDLKAFKPFHLYLEDVHIQVNYGNMLEAMEFLRRYAILAIEQDT